MDSKNPQARFWGGVYNILFSLATNSDLLKMLEDHEDFDPGSVHEPEFFLEITPKNVQKQLAGLYQNYFRQYLRPEKFGDFLLNGSAGLGAFISVLHNPAEKGPHMRIPHVRFFAQLQMDWILFILDEAMRFLLRPGKGQRSLPLEAFSKMCVNITYSTLRFAPDGGVLQMQKDVDLNLKGMYVYLLSLFCVVLPEKHPRLRLRQQFLALAEGSEEGRRVVVDIMTLMLYSGVSFLSQPRQRSLEYVMGPEVQCPKFSAFMAYFYSDTRSYKISVAVPESLRQPLYESLQMEGFVRSQLVSLVGSERGANQRIDARSVEEWELLLAHHRRGIRPGGVDVVDFDPACARLLRTTSVTFVQEGNDFPEVGLVRQFSFFGYRREMRGRIDAQGLISFDNPVSSEPVLEALFRFCVIRAYRNFLVGGHAVYDSEMRAIERRVSDDSPPEAPAYRTIIAPYLRRLPTGSENSPDTYRLARVAGYPLEYLNGQNERHVPLNFVPAFETPKDSSLPLYVPHQRFSSDIILASFQDSSIPQDTESGQ